MLFSDTVADLRRGMGASLPESYAKKGMAAIDTAVIILLFLK